MISHSNNCGKVASTYLDRTKIEKCDAENIALAIMTFFAHNKFDVKKMVGIHNDNTSVRARINNGAYTKLKKDVPSGILIKCACHSLPLPMPYATSECLPRTFLIAEKQLIFKFQHQTT